MTRLSTLADAERLLIQYSPPKMGGETYTIERMIKLMEFLGNPQHEYPVVHVAGTSGKTSTSYFIRNLLQQAGKCTGLTVSPHITGINERVQVNGFPLEESTFLAYLETFLDEVTASKLEPTYFELLMAFAYWVFAKEQVDYAVIETGLGGLLDASNVVSRSDKICVITPIGLDHTNVLGETLEAIATQKAGIIGKSQRVFSAEQDERAKAALDAAAEEQDTEVEYVEVHEEELPTLALFQHQNWQLAVRVYDELTARDALPVLQLEQLEQAMNAAPPGRFERYDIQGTPVLLDGAHNAQKLAALIASLPTNFNLDAVWIAALVQAPDTKIDACIDEIASLQIKHLICTEFVVGQDIKGRRSIPARQFTELAEQKGLSTTAISSLDEALESALQEKRPVVITGSLYLVSAIRPKLAAMTQTKP
ncbi:MAG TPA: Mur ligase family protein [Candidatus Saccharibacteria bacterium]|nr:Mur ligase family protein [Candidatus Saccharibacteria bacterium]